jgi:hypothetical protein
MLTQQSKSDSFHIVQIKRKLKNVEQVFGCGTRLSQGLRRNTKEQISMTRAVFEPMILVSEQYKPQGWEFSWSKVLLESLILAQLVKKFPAFYGTRNFISIYTKACQRSLPQTY